MPPKKTTNKSAPDGQDAGGSLLPATGPAPSGTTPAHGEVAGDGSSAAAVGAAAAVADADQDYIDARVQAITAELNATGRLTSDPVADDRFLKIIGPKTGRWRAGRHFGPEPSFVPIGELTLEQIDAINGDPQLLATLESAPDVSA